MPDSEQQEPERLRRILRNYEGREGFLIQLLLDLNSEFGWISRETMREVSLQTGIPISRIFRTASFYRAISLTPVGRHRISVCMGTACQVRGAKRLLDTISTRLGIKPGESTADGLFTLHRVNCLGCCAIGPVMVADDGYHGRMDAKGARRLIDRLSQGDASG